MKITLPNGVTIEGSPEQVSAVLLDMGYEPIGDDKYYFSESKGVFLAIKDMQTTHLRNAILKHYQEWVNSLREIRSPQVLVGKMTKGILDKTWLAMVLEYARRKEV